MAFSDKTVKELLEIPLKKPCCRTAFLSCALLLAKEENGKVIFSVRREEIALFLSELLASISEKEVTACQVKNGRHIRTLIATESPSLLKRFRKLQKEENIATLFSCENDKSVFARALFMLTGTITEPENKYFHLELRTPKEDKLIAKALASFGFPFSTIERGEEVGLYCKNSSTGADFLAFCGLHNLIFTLYNIKIEKEIRNNEQRATNLVVHNLDKSTKASLQMSEEIKKYKKEGKLSGLDSDLLETVELRIRHPEETLEQLAYLHNPPLTKSGLYHRLQKILAKGRGKNG